MVTHSDFKELLECFNARGVNYVIVGAHALGFHGTPRATGDLDILVEPTSINAERIILALADFGFADVGLSTVDFDKPDQVIQLGHPPVRIDIITSITGVSWATANDGKIAGVYADTPVHYLGREELIANKRSTGRTKDLADIEALGESPDR